MLEKSTPPEKIYRLLSRLCPAGFRNEFGNDLVDLFRDRWREGPANGSRLHRLHLVRRLFFDLIETAFLLRMEEFGAGLKNLASGKSPVSSPATHSGKGDPRHPWSGLGQELRLALRTLCRTPATTLVTLLTLAFGIGVNVTVFGVVDRILLSPPPHIQNPAEVVRVQFAAEDPYRGSFVMDTTSYPMFTQLRESSAFRQLAAVNREEMTFQTGPTTRAVSVSKVSENFFNLLGTAPHLGNFWAEDAGDQPIAVLSHAFWQSQLGGDGSIVGEAIRLNGQTFTVAGVAPAGFSGAGIEAVDLWVPIVTGMSDRPAGWQFNPGMRMINLVGRVSPDRSAGSVEEQATAAIPTRGFGPPGLQLKVVLSPLLPGRSSDSANPLGRLAFWLGGISAIVLLVALLNVLGLELLRSLERRRETSIKLALGISRPRLLRALAVETLLLTSLGALSGILIASWSGPWFANTLVPGLARAEYNIAPGAALLGALAALLAGGCSALVRYSQALHPRGMTGLRAGEGASGYRRSRLQGTLLVAQVALALTLVLGSGLFLRSLGQIVGQDLGIDVQNVYLVNLQFDPATASRQRYETYLLLEEDLRRLPEVEAIAHVVSYQFGPHIIVNVDVPDNPEPELFEQLPFAYPASQEYFKVLGIDLVSGRYFNESDGAGSERVVIVNRSLANHAWPGQDPLGRCLRIGANPGFPGTVADDAPCRRVVGVVNDSRIRRVRQELEPTTYQYYMPFDQLDFQFGPPEPQIGELMVRATPEARSIQARLLRESLSRSSSVLHAQIQPFQDLIDPQIRPVRLGAGLFSLFGALSLGLAALGLYAALSYMVGQRRREMGIRIALGAELRNILTLILKDGLRLVVLGTLAGALLAGLSAEWIRSYLFETGPQDPLVLGGSLVVLFGVGLLACVFPALRAARTDPNASLRYE